MCTYFYASINAMVALDIKKNSSCTCGIGNELSFFREKTGVLPDSVNFLSFIDNLHETGPSESWGALMASHNFGRYVNPI